VTVTATQIKLPNELSTRHTTIFIFMTRPEKSCL